MKIKCLKLVMKYPEKNREVLGSSGVYVRNKVTFIFTILGLATVDIVFRACSESHDTNRLSSASHVPTVVERK